MGSALSPGTKLGRYEIRSKIGEGGMGEVYLALDTKLDRKVALKILPAEVAAHPDRMKRFVQEARSASALNHPSIITIYEIEEIDSVNLIATEFIDGETLRQRLKNGPLRIGEVLEVAIHTASALAAAHAAGIVHRDIKPENIMLRRDGIVKVLDFGLAKLTARPSPESIDAEAPTRANIKTDPGVVMGTAVYMSPEQARGLSIDERTDIFSLGVVLYEMVAGRLPFDGSNRNEIMASVLSDKEPQPLTRYSSEAPIELGRIVLKALRKNRDERYQTSKDMLLDLKSLKQELEFERKLEGPVAAMGAGGERVAATSARAVQASSAEYVVNRIKQNTLIAAIGMGVLLVGMLSASYWFFMRRPATSATTINSIAVLPFINVNASSDSEYLSDGIADSLINSLSQLPRLKVIARGSVFSYKGKEVNPQDVGRELNVQALVTGRITQRGDDLSISVELMDTRDKSHIWGQQYNRKISGLLAVQEEISSDISENLRLKLTGEEQKRVTKRYTEDVAAYQLYLKGRHFADQYDQEGFRKAIEDLNAAIAKDPNYALAHAGLAEAYWIASGQSLPPREAMPKAREAAVKALSIDDTLAEAHTSLALVQAFYDYDLPGAEKEFKRAIELNPGSAAAHQWYGWYLAVLKRADEALREISRAQELDPLSLLINGELGMPFYFTHQPDRALELYRKAVEMDPNNSFARISLAMTYIQKRMYEEAISVASKPQSDDAYLLAATGDAYARLGKRTDAQKMIEKLKELSKQRYVPTFAMAIIHTGLGEKGQALELLEKSYENREDTMTWLNSDPILDDLRSEPRFQDLVRRVGQPH
ncbi:MAG TPA: protein kinase [Candidatus Acidoferrum sp.]|jgi:serine/threonine-protein kinase|nr:protein kinase [Candidatus Acidoferrum sp.]